MEAADGGEVRLVLTQGAGSEGASGDRGRLDMSGGRGGCREGSHSQALPNPSAHHLVSNRDPFKSSGQLARELQR